jgi:ribosomal protein L36
MKWTKIGYWDYLPVRKCMGFEHKIAKGMKKIGLPLHKSSIQKINRNDKEVKREVRSLTICTAKNTKTISLVTKSLNFILRQELSSDKATRR